MSASLSSYSVSGMKSPRPKHQVLLLEPDTAVLNYLRSALGRQYSMGVFSEEQPLLDCLEQGPEPDLLLIATHAAKDPGPLLLHLRSTRPHLPVVVLSCSAEVREVESVIRMGVRAIVMKPFIASDIQAVIEEHLALADRRPVADSPKEIPLTETNSFVRSSKRMRELEAQAALVARADIPVLILGESGTGKEVLALYTHKMSSRAQHMFLKVNCAAVPADLLESELFGYEQGAFTGAVKTKPGKFEICTGGTIFLDEIGGDAGDVAGQAAAGAAGWHVYAAGQPCADAGGCAGDRGDEHQYEGGDGEQDVSRGPLLSAEWIYAVDSAATATEGRDPGAGGVLHAAGGEALQP